MFDVLHDPDYRKEWDEHMMASIEIGFLNPNNDVGYYALSCPAPVKNRDFVLQRSWLDMDEEKLILNHSVNHKDYPAKKGYIRAISYLTGFVTDPRGKLPPWLVNKVTQKFAPKVVKQLKRAAEGYECWKRRQENPLLKPWIYPEQMQGTKISIMDCVDSDATHIELETDEENQ
ncbi:hypothetical protein GWI33_013714 [Rhynchophorus ferrugineus]|uniref:START domain-containing protein n=1 Tax=Rhynchophorus ferrugineus TaxID=354439 RepID=A0A834I6H1_RHYFE|nr:hypothetical protein GWI33_013714 [Rhynchophorus ferrugineus]